MGEGYERYDRLKNTINNLNNKKITLSRNHEWYKIHASYLNEYVEHFHDFNKVNTEITDKTFREKAFITQQLITQLLKDYNTYQWFGLYDYLRLNENLLWMADYVFEENDQDDLCDFISNLKV
jgi:hypothetical protein